MKLKIALFFLALLMQSKMEAQVLCVFCFEQNAPISNNTTNLIQNGSFETTTCTPWPGFPQYYCPSSSDYACDIANWVCTGGGSATYACLLDQNSVLVPDGNNAVYLGNSFCKPCSDAMDDVSCITLGDSCAIDGIPPGFPQHDPSYGGSTGVSISQSVSGLTIGDTYVLEFWSGGEDFDVFLNDGVFGVDVGFGNLMFANHPTGPEATEVGIRYIVEFIAASTTHTIKFTNWGHICSNCTEAILDDVNLYPVSELSPSITNCFTNSFIINIAQVPISCAGANDGTLVANAFGSTGPYSYLWSPGSQTNDTLFNVGPGTYSVTVTDSTGESRTDSITVLNPPLLTLGITASNDSICAGSQVILNASGGGGTPSYSYQWSSASDDTLAVNALSLNSSGYVALTLTDSKDCSISDSIFIEVFPNPQVTSSPDTCICLGSSVVISASGVPSYLWSTGATTSSITVSPIVDTFYIVSYANTLCSNEDTSFVCVHPVPTVVALGDTLIELGTSANLLANGLGPFYWSPSNTLSCNPCANPIASPESTTTYTVTVTNSFDCVSEDQVLVAVLDPTPIVPNIITPDGDGKNDQFYITGLKPGAKLEILNRWGNTVFSTDSYLNDWKGEVTNGVYFYVLTTAEGKTLHGFFHVTDE